MTAWSERDLISFFKNNPGAAAHPGVAAGIGDDCAVFRNLEGRDWITTTDMLVADVHFGYAWHPPRLLGRKSVAVNLSDIAAMGGIPHFAMVSIAIPASVEENWITAWYDGATEMLDTHECVLIGGDTVKSDVLTFNIVIIGSVPQHQAVMRNGAQPGEHIYVSGPLGSAAAGLEICRQASRFVPLDAGVSEQIRSRHLDPEPRLSLGAFLRRGGLVGAMQDLSDGLATDMAHIADQSGVGAEIDASALPSEEGLAAVCAILGTSPTDLQVSGGEDYELLFTVKNGADSDLVARIDEQGLGPVYKIGRIVEGCGVRLLQGGTSREISFQGYQHSGA